MSSKLESNHLIHDRSHRGHTQIGWLDSYHTFSFGQFYDPQRMGWRSLRVINEDRVIPGAGFAPHSHRDMEIFTYVLKGSLEHKDSLGNGSIIRPGEAQIMSAGTGITHSEYNASKTDPVHFLQIWVLPNQAGLPPRYEQREFPLADRESQLRLIASPQGEDGAITIHQDVKLYTAVLNPGDQLTYNLNSDRYGWLQIAQGEVTLNEQQLRAGDGVQLIGSEALTLTSVSGGEILLFDLA